MDSLAHPDFLHKEGLPDGMGRESALAILRRGIYAISSGPRFNARSWCAALTKFDKASASNDISSAKSALTSLIHQAPIATRSAEALFFSSPTCNRLFDLVQDPTSPLLGMTLWFFRRFARSTEDVVCEFVDRDLVIPLWRLFSSREFDAAASIDFWRMFACLCEESSDARDRLIAANLFAACRHVLSARRNIHVCGAALDCLSCCFPGVPPTDQPILCLSREQWHEVLLPLLGYTEYLLCATDGRARRQLRSVFDILDNNETHHAKFWPVIDVGFPKFLLHALFELPGVAVPDLLREVSNLIRQIFRVADDIVLVHLTGQIDFAKFVWAVSRPAEPQRGREIFDACRYERDVREAVWQSFCLVVARAIELSDDVLASLSKSSFFQALVLALDPTEDFDPSFTLKVRAVGMLSQAIVMLPESGLGAFLVPHFVELLLTRELAENAAAALGRIRPLVPQDSEIQEMINEFDSECDEVQ
jgi:hypothetical protein